MTSGEEIFAWGTQAVDPSAHDLPGLKAKFLLGHLPTTGRIVDVGCGGGKLLRSIAEHRPSLDRHGCDIRPIGEIQRDFEFRSVDREGELPYPNGFADAVIVVDVLEHVQDPASMVAELHRICRPEGTLISFVPMEGGFAPHRFFRLVLGDDLYRETKDHVQAFSYGTVRAIIERDFVIAEQEFAYHLLGGLMDATFFAMLKSKKLRELFWTENLYYRGDGKTSTAGQALNKLLVAANRLAWLESSIMAHSRHFSSGLLVVATCR